MLRNELADTFYGIDLPEDGCIDGDINAFYDSRRYLKR
jgi:hypothetical protein